MSHINDKTEERYERIWADMVERKSRAIRNRENYSRDIDEGEPVIYASAIRDATKAIDAMRWRQYQQQQRQQQQRQRQRNDNANNDNVNNDNNRYKSLYKYLN